jgi:hypothetical protein
MSWSHRRRATVAALALASASIASSMSCLAAWIPGFKDLPPRQEPGSFNLSSAMEKLTANQGD